MRVESLGFKIRISGWSACVCTKSEVHVCVYVYMYTCSTYASMYM